MTLKEAIMSDSNLMLLKQYSLKKLKLIWPKEKDLLALIELNLDSAIANLFDTKAFDTWQLTRDNVAELNQLVWSSLRDAVRRSIEGRPINYSKAIDEMLESKHKIQFEERESLTTEKMNFFDS